MCRAFQTLRCNNIAKAPALVSCCSFFLLFKGPTKELRLSFMLGEKYQNKIFLLFSGSESAEVSLN